MLPEDTKTNPNTLFAFRFNSNTTGSLPNSIVIPALYTSAILCKIFVYIQEASEEDAMYGHFSRKQDTLIVACQIADYTFKIDISLKFSKSFFKELDTTLDFKTDPIKLVYLLDNKKILNKAYVLFHEKFMQNKESTNLLAFLEVMRMKRKFDHIFNIAKEEVIY